MWSTEAKNKDDVGAISIKIRSGCLWGFSGRVSEEKWREEWVKY